MKRLPGALLVVALLGSEAAAQTPGVSFGGAPTTFESATAATRGWQFSVSDAIFVTALGLYDVGADGFASSHQIGLWNAASDLLASLLMPAGTAAPLGADNFRYLGIGSVLLNPGIYRIGAFYGAADPDLVAFEAAPLGAAGFVEYQAPRIGSGAFTDPTMPSGATGGTFGPNFLFESAQQHVIPEPISMILLGTGLAGLGAVRARRRDRSHA